MTRRSFAMAAAAGAASLKTAAAAAKSEFGIATTCYMTVRKFRDTLEFLDHSHSLGAAGIQSALTSLDPEYLSQVERRAKDWGMFIEVMSGLPDESGEKFKATMEAAKKIGALCVRSACLGGRRYETFATREEWSAFVSKSKAALARAVPLADKMKMPFAIENHKDWTVDEMVPLLKAYSSSYFGCCLDTGNNMALLDDPYDVVDKLAPFAISTHIKDMAVAEYPDGFLLSEVVLGEGILDLKRMVARIRAAHGQTKLVLEMITRDPLKVPVLTPKYWTTFEDRSGAKLAAALKLARESKKPLPTLSQLPPDQQRAAEEKNVQLCLAAVV